MDKHQIQKEFVSPSVAYRGKPFWSWNGELRGEELVRQAKIMKEMGLGGYFMHSRAGLITEYLGEEWFDRINEVADVAEADGMEAWLYDEDRWPSGSAGGKVTIDPQYRMKSLVAFEAVPEKFTWRDDLYALYVGKLKDVDLWHCRRIDLADASTEEAARSAIARAIEEAKAKEQAGGTTAPGEWKVIWFAIVPDTPNSNYNGTTYIDTMSLKATRRFIELTHEEYKKHCGDRLGRSIKGIFTDEPHRGACMGNRSDNGQGVISCGIFWTDDIFEEFEKRYGFDAKPLIPYIFYRENGELIHRVKLHYIDLGCNLFVERFAKPYNEWCEKNGIIFTGHVLHEDSLMTQTCPNGSLMRFYEHMGYPGMDCLNEDNNVYWAAKQLSSATRQLGKKWALSELYGCTGWQFNFKSHKAVGDWQALFGVNVRCQHLSWYTMEGESKRDYPASILHQSTWYKDYAKVEDYFARFGLVMSEGDPECDLLVMNPIESLWCQANAGWANWIFNVSPHIAPYEKRYVDLFHTLAGHQIDFDYGEEEMMSRLASVDTDAAGRTVLRVGQASYRAVLVTNMLTIRPTTVALLKEFMEKGGKVIFAGQLPTHVDAVKSDAPATLAAMSGAVVIPDEEDALVAAIRDNTDAYVRVVNADGEVDKQIFAQVRRNFGGDGYAVVVLNTDRNNAKKDLTLTLAVPAGYHVQEWNMENGERYDASPVAGEAGGCTCVALDLEAAGTRCFVLTKETESLPVVTPGWTTVRSKTITGEFDYTTDEKNVCVLDWAKWRWAGQAWHDEAEVLKVDQAIRSDVGIEHRGGEMLQPWFSKLHHKQVYGALELSYEFFIDEIPNGEIYLAGERPETNHYKINGVALHNEDINDFWVDDCFKRMRIPADALKQGRNEVTVNVDFMRTTNVEALYLIGDFGVTLDVRKRTLVGLPTKIGCENFDKYNLPFYTGCMTYHLTPAMYKDILDDDGDRADRIVLSPASFRGGCVKVTALGKTTVLGWDPYEADVTEAYRQGAPIDVTVVGTRRNVFGPLHQFPPQDGGCGPGNFVTGGSWWSDQYCFINSGLTGIILKAQMKD